MFVYLSYGLLSSLKKGPTVSFLAAATATALCLTRVVLLVVLAEDDYSKHKSIG